VLLATGVLDIEPKLPNLLEAVRRRYVRHCPICDAYEVIDQNVGIIGYSERALQEAQFLRGYTPHLTLLTLGERLSGEQHDTARSAGIRVVEEPVIEVEVQGPRIAAIRTEGGREYRFDTVYSALGAWVRSELALALGAEHTEDGELLCDDHQRTSVPGLYAAGDVVHALNQIAVAMGQAAIATTDIHNALREGR
jgi:thioredoxin reductase (NADPH)